MSAYSRAVSQNFQTGGERIFVFTKEEALDWAMRAECADDEVFKDMIEDA